MKQVISTERLPIKMWLDDMGEGALEQAKNLANLPFVFKHIAIMPDSHQGYGVPIGGVMATKGVIVPNAVGVDIGCGMIAVKTAHTIDDVSTEMLKEIMSNIRETVPVGFKKHKEEQDADLLPVTDWEESDVSLREIGNARKSLGTLGGGNHFIEIQKDEEGFIWIMIHSGSRNIGKQVADHYNKLAIELNEKNHSSVPKEWQLAFLPEDSEEGRAYIREMNYCVEFALANRELMMNRALSAFANVVGVGIVEQRINIAHNYAALENHFGKNVWIHRKGATIAREGTVGIIPGSQGSSSYIVEGLGNRDSFMSCSHGAGRKLGRKKAEQTLDLAAEQELLNSQGIIHTIRTAADLDEAPSAYKDIETVMENQSDLVKIVTRLTPLAVIKG